MKNGQFWKLKFLKNTEIFKMFPLFSLKLWRYIFESDNNCVKIWFWVICENIYLVLIGFYSNIYEILDGVMCITP